MDKNIRIAMAVTALIAIPLAGFFIFNTRAVVEEQPPITVEATQAPVQTREPVKEQPKEEKTEEPEEQEEVKLDTESNSRYSILTGMDEFTMGNNNVYHMGDNVYAYRKNDLVYFVDTQGTPYETEKAIMASMYSSRISFENNLGQLRSVNDKTGFVDVTGTYILPPIYKYTSDFTKNGFAVAAIQNGNYFIMDVNGEQISGTYNYLNIMKDWETGNYVISAEKLVRKVTGATQKVYSVIDEKETILLDHLDEAPDLSIYRGFFVFKSGGKWGVYDINKKEIAIEPTYKYISLDNELFVLRDDKGYFYYDYNTKTKYKYLDNTFMENNFLRGHIAEPVDRIGNTYLIDNNGKILFEALYIQIGQHTTEKKYLYFLFGKNGVEAKNSVVDLEGNIYLEGDFYNLSFLTDDKLMYKENKSNQVKIRDLKNKETIDTEFINYEINDYNSEKTVVLEKSDGSKGIADIDFNWLVEPEKYEYIYNYGNGIYYAMKNGENIVFFDKITSAKRYEPVKNNADFEKLINETQSEDFVVSVDKPRAILMDSNAYADSESWAQSKLSDRAFKGKNILLNSAPVMKDGVVYFDFENFRNQTAYSSQYYVTDPLGVERVVFTYDKGALTFYKNEKRVLWTKFNIDKKVFENEEIYMDKAFSMAQEYARDHVGRVPLGFAMDTIGKQMNIYDDIIVVTDKENKTEPEEVTLTNYKERLNWSYSKEEFPGIDGSTSTFPFSVKLFSRLLNVDQDTAESSVYHSKTDNAYRRLIYGESDIIFVTPPSDLEYQMAQQENVEFELIPFAKEGFVFFVNKNNKVENLTSSQIQDIYQGKIGNWRKVGGEDKEIQAFQRNKNSGSQTLMETVVMKGLELMKVERQVLSIHSMEGIIDTVSEYDNSSNSIGYSVYYFANDMYASDEIKLLSVDGVAPTQETIKDETYPFVVNYYMVIRKDSPKDSKERKLAEFVLSKDGQELVLKSGLVPVN